jgi:hypothetical protein
MMSETSKEAFESIQPVAGNMRAMVYGFIQGRGQYGATCDEIEEGLDMRHQTCSARVRDLVKDGSIRFKGEKRKTRSGRKAEVYTTAVML